MAQHDCPLAKLVRTFDGTNPETPGPGPVWAAFDKLHKLLPQDEEIQTAAAEFGDALNARLAQLHDALRACDGQPPLDRTP